MSVGPRAALAQDESPRALQGQASLPAVSLTPAPVSFPSWHLHPGCRPLSAGFAFKGRDGSRPAPAGVAPAQGRRLRSRRPRDVSCGDAAPQAQAEAGGQRLWVRRETIRFLNQVSAPAGSLRAEGQRLLQSGGRPGRPGGSGARVGSGPRPESPEDTPSDSEDPASPASPRSTRPFVRARLTFPFGSEMPGPCQAPAICHRGRRGRPAAKPSCPTPPGGGRGLCRALAGAPGASAPSPRGS